MTSLDELLRLVPVEADEVHQWIENRWVMPASSQSGYVFEEVDVARVRLIVEMRREFALDEEAVPLVLSLLDQVYGLRRELRRLCGALAQQPPEIREAIAAVLEDQTVGRR
jgi:chaperone modulatory protein CbpM